MNNEIRTRTYEWNDPIDNLNTAWQMAGFDYLHAINSGEVPLPPLSKTLQFGKSEISHGSVSFNFEPQEFHYNTLGTVHGGVIAAILDTAMGCTLQSTLPAGILYTTLELKVNFIKAVTIKAKSLVAKGTLIHAGKSTAVIAAELVDSDGKVYAHSTSTCLLLRK